MTDAQVQVITRQRLECWGERLAEDHCTPAVLIGVGHDHRAGDLHICVPHDLPIQVVRDYLARALDEVEVESARPGIMK
jgi:hypothetical protein